MGGHELILNSLWLNSNSWLAVSEHFINFFQNNKLVYQWSIKQKSDLTLIARSGFIYALHNNASGDCINLINKTLVSTTSNNKALIEGQPVLFYDKLNDQPLVLNKNNLYELEFNQNKISAKLIATLKNLPTDVASVVLHNNKRIVFVSTNTTGVYIYRLSPFRVYKSGNDDVLNNNYASILTDSSHIFTCRSLLFDLNTGGSFKIPTFTAKYLLHCEMLTHRITNLILESFPSNVKVRNPFQGFIFLKRLLHYRIFVSIRF